MARLPRLTVAGHPHHIIQRGNNRQPIFGSDADRRVLLDLLADSAAKFQVAIHAHVLMNNHFHVLATPDTADGVPQMMQAVGRRYVRLFNNARGRTGTLWEGRYRSTVIQSDRYLLACMAYLDLNPVRAGWVASPADHEWSSHGHYVGTRVDPMITPHPLVWGLGNTPFAREAAYRDLVQQGLPAPQLQALTESALNGWVLGDAAFVARLQGHTQRRLVKASAGRPTRALAPPSTEKT